MIRLNCSLESRGNGSLTNIGGLSMREARKPLYSRVSKIVAKSKT